VDALDGAECAEEFTMVQRRRPIYTPEFKSEAVRRARTSTQSIPAIARDLGITPTALRNWIAATRPEPGVALTDDERTELRRLRREVTQLRQERDILKKATAFFAKYSE
jgi:transposase